MNSKFTPEHSQWQNNISFCSTSHKTVLNTLQEKAKSQTTTQQRKRAAEGNVIPSALGPWNNEELGQ